VQGIAADGVMIPRKMIMESNRVTITDVESFIRDAEPAACSLF
jgi:hypothetical protein